ncbi:hypothetical protein EW145_g7841 [Phellinidium pouzarii]|uniref:Uncharacterized protein n=1 Tax=Phellinidium pouzarii TaxID=167371 RepID=A0A4S4KDG5_9AGAM|nr:hypothetical protein EW145_g7841 [Phellinidium pouzarii]
MAQAAVTDSPHPHPHQHQQQMHQHQHQHQHQPLHHPYPLQAHHVHSPHPHAQNERERDVHGLRLALGSILSPKRYASPSSHASSGSASPAHFGPGLVHAYPHPPPHGNSHLHTPSSGHASRDEQSGHDEDHAHANAHFPEIGKPVRPGGMMSRTHSSSASVEAPHGNPETTVQREHDTSVLPILTTSNYTTLSPSQTQRVVNDVKRNEPGSNANTHTIEATSAAASAAGYIATLQSKRAWDALVHGSMS